ncbi:hypothetical protein JCM5353_002876 [Sporobolomyces roseus]
MATTLSHSRNPSSTPNPNLPSTSTSSSALFPPPPPHRRIPRMSTPSAPNPPSPAPQQTNPNQAPAVVIDLTETSDSSPVQPLHTPQILGGRFPHLSFPNSNSNSNQGNAVAGPSNLRRTGQEEITLSSDSDEGNNGVTSNWARRSTRRAARSNVQVQEDDDDIVIVSHRPAIGQPLPPPSNQPIGFGRYNQRNPASPQPYILPPSASSSHPRTRIRQEDPDPLSARLAAQLAAEESSSSSSSNPASYLRAQQLAMQQAQVQRGRGFGGYILRANTNNHQGAQGGGGQEDALEQLLSTGGAAGYAGDRQGYMERIYAAIGSGIGGGRGGMFGGLFEGGLQGLYGGGFNAYGGAGPSHAAGGWGGAAKVRAATKKYGVRLSHPLSVQKGFSRDIIEPLEEEASGPSPAKKKKRESREVIIEELEPVCASCEEGLRMGSEGRDGKIWGLSCGHVVCGRCLREAKERNRGGWKLNVSSNEEGEEEVVGRSPKKGKGKKRVIQEEEEDEEMRSLKVNETDQDEEEDLYAPPSDQDEPSHQHHSSSSRYTTSSSTSDRRLLPPPSTSAPTTKGKKGKGKGKAKAKIQDESLEIEEDWTLCPVKNCEAKKGNDLMAEEGWSKPFELYA